MFDCKRCGSSFVLKSNLKLHLNRKRPCQAVLSDISAETLLKELPGLDRIIPDITYPCTKCGKQFNHKSNMYVHRKTCNGTNYTFSQIHIEYYDEKTKIFNPDREDYPGHLYIIHIREFRTQNIPIYKVGRSRNILTRIKAYPKNSNLIYTIYTDHIKYREELLLDRLKKTANVTQELEYGLEYFRGDPRIILKTLECVVSEIIPKTPKENIHVTIDENENVSREHIFQILDDNKE